IGVRRGLGAWENHPVVYGRGGYHPEVVSAASNPITGRGGAAGRQAASATVSGGRLSSCMGRPRVTMADPEAARARPLNFSRRWRSQGTARPRRQEYGPAWPKERKRIHPRSWTSNWS